MAQLQQLLMTARRTLASQKIVVNKVINLAVIVDDLECLELDIQIEDVLLQLQAKREYEFMLTILCCMPHTTESMVNCSTKSSFSYLVSMSKC